MQVLDESEKEKEIVAFVKVRNQELIEASLSALKFLFDMPEYSSGVVKYWV